MDITITLAIIASATGILALIAKLMYSSKCYYIRCCGCECKRNTDGETKVTLDSEAP